MGTLKNFTEYDFDEGIQSYAMKTIDFKKDYFDGLDDEQKAKKSHFINFLIKKKELIN